MSEPGSPPFNDAMIETSGTAAAVESLIRVCVADFFRYNASEQSTNPKLIALVQRITEAVSLDEHSIAGPGGISLAGPEEQLQAFKSALKKRLRQYDDEFARDFRRKPDKGDKEPIRHLYQRYHEVKKCIDRGPGTSSIPGGSAASASSSAPRSGTADSSARDGAESVISAVGSVPGSPARSTRSEDFEVARASNVSPSTIANLRREKRQLQIVLREYEDKFLRENGRRVKYHRDIAPVANEYRRYKAIKNTLKINR